MKPDTNWAKYSIQLLDFRRLNSKRDPRPSLSRTTSGKRIHHNKGGTVMKTYGNKPHPARIMPVRRNKWTPKDKVSHNPFEVTGDQPSVFSKP